MELLVEVCWDCGGSLNGSRWTHPLDGTRHCATCAASFELEPEAEEEVDVTTVYFEMASGAVERREVFEDRPSLVYSAAECGNAFAARCEALRIELGAVKWRRAVSP